MLREMRGAHAILDDPLLEEYINNMSYRLVAHSETPDQPFTFFIVRSEQINAFAAPGGYVGLNAGLITTAETESEVAAVLAHEIAHVTQNHLVRAFERMKHASLPIALAMIGALIAAQGSGDASQAAVIGGAALLQQKQINFTRDNEYEADRVGIHTLAHAGFNPEAMADFFARMGKATRSNSGENVPEFLRTHPVTTTRISEAKSRAAQIKPDTQRQESKTLFSAAPWRALPTTAGDEHGVLADKKTVLPLWDTPEDSFECFRERARVLASKDPVSLLAHYQRQQSNAPLSICSRYGQGLAQISAGKYSQATATFSSLTQTDQPSALFLLALADADAASGKSKEALLRIAQLHRQFDGNAVITIIYAQHLVASGESKAAQQAITLLRPLLRTQFNQPLFQSTLARAYQLAKDEVRAGESYAELALLNGQFNDALLQLNLLLKRPNITYYQRARIEARIAQVTPSALEQRRQLQTQPTDAP